MKKEIKQKKDFNSDLQIDKIKEKFNDSTSTVDELRHAIFAPINNFTHNSKTKIEMDEKKKITRHTNWGEITVENTLLCQKHKDVYDCILTYAKQINLKNEPNTIAYAFTGQGMNKKYYGENNKSKNLKNLDKLLTDMMSSVITIKPSKTSIKHKFQIFSYAGYSEEYKSYIVKINYDYAKFFASSLTINYEDELPEILKVKDPIIKAIVRLALTQKDSLQMKIYDPDQPLGKTGILEAIGFPIESRSQQQKAFKSLNDNVEILKNFGVYYNPSDKSTVRYKKKLDIRFIPSVVNRALNKKGIKEKDDYIKLQELINEKFIKNEELYLITEIKLNTESDKIELFCKKDNNKDEEIQKMNLDNTPSKIYEWLKNYIVKEDENA